MNEENIQTTNDETTDAELERLRLENEDLRSRERMAAARSEMDRMLALAGARSPGLIFETLRDEVRFDAEGKPENVADLVDAVRTRYPEQFGREVQAAAIDAASGAASGRAVVTAGMLRQMTPAEIARLDWEEVRRALREG